MTSMLSSSTESNLGSFLSAEKIIELDNQEITLFFCQFNINHYHSSMFELLEINFPKEIQNSVSKRQAEFLAGRYAAKMAIEHQNPAMTDTTVHIGKQRSPIWPKGLLGSISHSTDHAVCAIRPDSNMDKGYIGVDIESLLEEQTVEQIKNFVHTQSEANLLLQEGIPYNTATTLIFSAKESLFKALYPTLQVYFEFTDVTLIGYSKVTKTLTLSLSEKLLQETDIKQVYDCTYILEPQQVLTIVHD